MHQVEQQAQGFVEDATSNLDFLRTQVAEANARALEATQADLTVCQAQLSRVHAELHQAQFQLSQQKILCQVKEREIQRLRSASLSATDASQAASQAAAASSAGPNYPNHQLRSFAPTESLPSWVHLDAPVSTSPVVEEVHKLIKCRRHLLQIPGKINLSRQCS